MVSSEIWTMSMDEQFYESFGSININKLRGSGIVNEINVHGCPRSQSHDSGLVIDIDACIEPAQVFKKGHFRHTSVDAYVDQPAVFQKGHYRSNSSDYHGERTSGLARRNFTPRRSLSNSLVDNSYPFRMLNGHRSGDVTPTISEDGLDRPDQEPLANGCIEESEMDQSQDTIKTDFDRTHDSVLSDDDEPCTPCAESREPVSCIKCEPSSCSCNTKSPVREPLPSDNHQSNTINGHVNSSYLTMPNCVPSPRLSPRHGRKLDPRKLDLSLNVKPLEPVIPEQPAETTAGQTAEPPPPVVAKSRLPAAKQSWLLRLFESKLFEMSIAITYLYNSKEPGVQTYIGKSAFCHHVLFQYIGSGNGLVRYHQATSHHLSQCWPSSPMLYDIAWSPWVWWLSARLQYLHC